MQCFIIQQEIDNFKKEKSLLETLKKIKVFFNTSYFQITILLFFILFVFWNGLWGGAPRADHLIYLHRVSEYTNFWDIVINSPAWNRTHSAGDFILYRPILFLQLGLFYYFFKYNFFYWQLASLTLHIFVVFGLYFLLRQGALKKTIYPLLIAAFFGCSYLSSELVLWNHISGYITFSLFTIYAIFYITKFLQTDKTRYGYIALILGILCEFTYELGVVFNGLLAIVLGYKYFFISLRNRKKAYLILSLLFISAMLFYPIISLTDLKLREYPLSSSGGGSNSFIYALSLSLWFALKQIVFWIGGWFLPTGYEVDAAGRASFGGFKFFGEKFLYNYALLIFLFCMVIGKIKINLVSSIRINKIRWYLVLIVGLFLYAYSIVIAYGRALPRGLGYVFNSNIYYAYMACLTVAVGFAVYFLVKPINDNQRFYNRMRVFNDNVLFIFIILGLIFFNACLTYNLASDYRYKYSPPILQTIGAVENYIKLDNSKSSYFDVDSSCLGNYELPWFNDKHFRRGSNWTGTATIADVLFPEKSFKLNKNNISDKKYDVVKVNCTKVSASSTLNNFGPSGLIVANNPGWHAVAPTVYPQILDVDLGYKQKIKHISFLPQEGLVERAPHSIMIEIRNSSDDWREVFQGELDCSKNSKQWRTVSLSSKIDAQLMRIHILSNCGDSNLLTLRGLRIE